MDRPQRFALCFLTTAAPVCLLTFLVGGPWAEHLFAFLAMAFPVAFIALACARSGGLGTLKWSLLLLLLWLEGTILAMLWLADREPVSWMGLPLSAWIMLLGIWLGPLVIVSWAYAATFEQVGLRESDLERLRRLPGARKLRGNEGGEG